MREILRSLRSLRMTMGRTGFNGGWASFADRASFAGLKGNGWQYLVIISISVGDGGIPPSPDPWNHLKSLLGRCQQMLSMWRLEEWAKRWRSRHYTTKPSWVQVPQVEALAFVHLLRNKNPSSPLLGIKYCLDTYLDILLYQQHSDLF